MNREGTSSGASSGHSADASESPTGQHLQHPALIDLLRVRLGQLIQCTSQSIIIERAGGYPRNEELFSVSMLLYICPTLYRAQRLSRTSMMMAMILWSGDSKHCVSSLTSALSSILRTPNCSHRLFGTGANTSSMSTSS